MQRVAQLLKDKARFALTLRNGPAGLGSCVYPTDINRCIAAAGESGLKPVFKRAEKPSLMEHKEKVSWAYLVLEKQ